MATTSTTPVDAVQQDEAQIRHTVQLYADGFGSHETRLFEEAFHADAWIFFTEADGKLRASPLASLFSEWASSADRASIRVLQITHSGDVANVLLLWRSGTPDNTWLDLHNLLKIDGAWKITNKTATHFSRAGEAARRIAGEPAL